MPLDSTPAEIIGNWMVPAKHVREGKSSGHSVRSRTVEQASKPYIHMIVPT